MSSHVSAATHVKTAGVLKYQVPKERRAPDVQIGISVFQQPLKWLQQAVDSALNQEGEYSIVCTIRVDGPDACDEASKKWLAELSEKSNTVEVIFGEERLGTFGSYKEIFEQAPSEYICQLDADDWLEKNAIEYCIKILEDNPSTGFVYTGYNQVDEDGKFIAAGARNQEKFNLDRQLVQFNTFHLRLIRRSHYKIIGGYNEKLKFVGDYDLSMKLAERATPLQVKRNLYNYRLHSNNTSRIKKNSITDEALRVALAALKRRHQEHLWDIQLINDKQKGERYVALKPKKGPIIIAGMHRSGTSILALSLQKIGVNLGKNLILADRQNPDGYGEDKAVLEINRNALQRTTGHSKGGWMDWGWSDEQNTPPFRGTDEIWKSQAKYYLEGRANHTGFWGWKDPRNTLLLDEWLKLEPQSKVLGIYRYPWEIVDALQRIMPPIFLKNTSWCLEIWNQYNTHLVSFAEKHPERTIIVNSRSFIKNPLSLLPILKKKWNWSFEHLNSSQIRNIEKLIRPNRHQGVSEDDPLVRLHLTCSPRSEYLFNRLESISDLPSPLKTDAPAQRHLTIHTTKNTVEKPEISIIITSHNQGDLLLEAVASAERYKAAIKSEILIIDDGSIDKRTCEVLSCLKIQGYRVIRQYNQGLPTARNNGIKYAKSDIILFLDDDNRLLSPYFTQGLELMKRNEKVDVVYGDRKEFGLKNKLVKIGNIPVHSLWTMNKIDNCALIRKNYIERCGGYCRELSGLGFEDWDLWLSGLSHPLGLNMVYLNEACFEYRVRPDSLLQKLLEDQSRQARVMSILRKRHGYRLGHGGFFQ